MKKISIILLLAFVLQIILQPTTFALMAKPGPTSKAPPMATEDDGYRPEIDPLPEWLLLPDGTTENSFQYSGSQDSELNMTQTGTERWTILIKNNGSKIEYSYFENDVRQFVIKANKHYEKFTIFIKNGKKLQRTEAVDPSDYFDTSTELALRDDRSFSLYGTAYAANEGPGPTSKQKASKKRVSSKLSKRQVNKLVHKVGFKGADAQIANRVIWVESRDPNKAEILPNGKMKYNSGYVKIVACENNTDLGFNPVIGGGKRLFGVKAANYCEKNGDGAGRGLFQISSQYHKKCTNKCAFSAEKNARFAYKIRKKLGWTQWCSYGCTKNTAGAGPAMTEPFDNFE